jgi:hypothetical protein
MIKDTRLIIDQLEVRKRDLCSTNEKLSETLKLNIERNELLRNELKAVQ